MILGFPSSIIVRNSLLLFKKTLSIFVYKKFRLEDEVLTLQLFTSFFFFCSFGIVSDAQSPD